MCESNLNTRAQVVTPAGLREARRRLGQGRAKGRGDHGSWDKRWHVGGGRREARRWVWQRLIPRKRCVVFLGNTNLACARLGTWKG